MFLFVFISCNIYASRVYYDNSSLRCILDSGNIATSSWIWLDTNKDSIAECYRFDEDGNIAKKYVDSYGRSTNEEGQLVENGFVVQKMLSSGKIIRGEGMPYVEAEYKQKDLSIKGPEADDSGNNKVIKTAIINENFIGPRFEPDSGVIYSGDSGVLTVDNKGNVSKVAGKNIKKFIVSKGKCKVDVEKVTIYGDKIWEDAIELSGNESYIKINLKGNNYIQFEVGNEPHVMDEKDIYLTLDMYADGGLIDRIDEFVDGEPVIYEEEFFNNEKTIELRVHIEGGQFSRKVYLRNAVIRKLRHDE